MEFFLQKTLSQGEHISSVDTDGNARAGGYENKDILTINKRSVVWYAKGGARVVRKFCFETTVTAAVFCTFVSRPYTSSSSSSSSSNSSSNSNSNSNSSSSSNQKKCIAIMLSSTYIQVHQYSGESYDIHVPCPMASMVPTKHGLLFQAERALTTAVSTAAAAAAAAGNRDASFTSTHSNAVKQVSLYVMTDPSAPLLPVHAVGT
jgi:hypothetical protein